MKSSSSSTSDSTSDSSSSSSSASSTSSKTKPVAKPKPKAKPAAVVDKGPLLECGARIKGKNAKTYWCNYRMTARYTMKGDQSGWEAACEVNHVDGGNCRKVFTFGRYPDRDTCERSMKFFLRQGRSFKYREEHRDMHVPADPPTHLELELGTPPPLVEGCTLR